jgi:demethylmenaquinone methyltransferase/2-methoxy-6-polyprenyl-1,4-benzoquinol methylase
MEKRPDEVSGMFDDVARGYDRTNDLLSLGNAPLWRIATVRAIDPQPGERILDIAAGTGTSSAVLAKSGATVVAVDFSPGMIAEGRRRHPHLEFVEADAARLPFGDDEFDAVTISFGLRNIADPIVALGEMYRVLKPGGRLVICEFSHPSNPLMRLGYDGWMKLGMPLVTKLASSNPDAYRYLLESIEQWPDQQTLAQWIRGAGFARVAYRNLTGGVVALHRGRTPVDPAVRASAARRRGGTRPRPSTPLPSTPRPTS